MKSLWSALKRFRSRLKKKLGLSPDEWEDVVEQWLIEADVGMDLTEKIIDEVSGHLSSKPSEEEIITALKESLLKIFAEHPKSDLLNAPFNQKPHVLFIIGVNGTGKTTTIGKLAYLYTQKGLKVVLGAGDTFRAAAIEQLEKWAERSGARIIKGNYGGDPGSVAYQAIESALAKGDDVVILDSAGRLHNKRHLMEELTKVRRVIKKKMPDAPHETLLVIDATTGQTGLEQAKIFKEFAEPTGIVLTKMDGTAKGGIALPIWHKLRIPIKLVGVGEQPQDLIPFKPEEYVSALLPTKSENYDVW
ncbi:MAG: signal recognition particle-docking protein FtsY [Chlorobi bacterium]|nr:signal recognition particle-docking protein FtsY [Chlorobiota bacterium]